MTDVAHSEWSLARALPARLRDPRRLLAILLLAISGGLVLAFLWARGELAGSDAYAYWTAVHRWLAGEDIYQVVPGLDLPPAEGALPYAYAPWSLYLFLPFALIPWDLAWVGWRLANVVLFAASVAWAYDRRPLGTATLVALLAPSLAANLDTGNINVFIALTPWLAWLASARAGGVAWAIGTALKWVPAPLLLFMPRASWRIGLVTLGVLFVLTLATWPQFMRQLEIVLDYPRPLRIDYLILVWGLVPWLWARPWPPRLTRSWAFGAEDLGQRGGAVNAVITPAPKSTA